MYVPSDIASLDEKARTHRASASARLADRGDRLRPLLAAAWVGALAAACGSATSRPGTSTETSGSNGGGVNAGSASSAATASAASSGASSAGREGSDSASSGGTSANASSGGSGAASSGGSNGGSSGGGLTPCVSQFNCSNLQYCDALGSADSGVCCPHIDPGSTLYVDDQSGSDVACCGTTIKTPCATLTQSMANIVAAGAHLSTLIANHSGEGHNWLGHENSPLQLGEGVTLHAPGIYFPRDAGETLFWVQPYGPSDTDPVSIEGDAISDTFLGLSIDDSTGSLDNHGCRQALTVLAPLHLQYATASGATPIVVGGGGTLTLGPGPVTVGGGILAGTRGLEGITCVGTADAPATLSEVFGAGGRPVLQVANQAHTDLYLRDNCHASLGFGTILGAIDSQQVCLNGPGLAALDRNGILMDGSASLLLERATIQCMILDGLSLLQGPIGQSVPSLQFENGSVTRCGCAGMQVGVGTADTAAVVFSSNGYGVVEQGSGSVDLTGSATPDPMLGGSSLVCNGAEGLTCLDTIIGGNQPTNGYNLWIDGTGTVNADDVYWPDATPPGYLCQDTAAQSCNEQIGQAVSTQTTTAPSGADWVVSPAPGQSGPPTYSVSQPNAYQGSCP